MGFVRGDPQGPRGATVHGEYGKLSVERRKQRRDSKVSLEGAVGGSGLSLPPSRQTHSRKPSVESSPVAGLPAADREAGWGRSYRAQPHAKNPKK